MSEADAAAGVNVNGNENSRNADGAKSPPSSSAIAPSRRQRRIQLQYHSSNGLWEQPQPRIKKASQREAAYLRASGLVPTSKSNPVDDTTIVTPATAATTDDRATKANENHDVTRHFARQLGSTDARIRHQTIRQLRAYLKVRSDVKNAGLSEMDMIKLWKCFWYTLYLADRVPVQEELCQQLCSLIWSVAGTVEQDEYIAQSYLNTMNASEFSDDEDDEEDMDDVKDECGNEGLEVMYMEDEDGEDSSESDDVDFEAKQLALIEEEEEDDDNDDECGGCEKCDDEVGKDNDDDDDDDSDEEGEEDPMDVRHCQGAHLAALFARTFWRTCVREWGKMDKYRVDKFYTCLRYMLAAMYDYMALRHWSLGIIHLFNDALHEEVLLQVPNGVRYHIVDCCLEELCKAMHRSGGIPLTEATFIDVLEPFFALAQTGDGDDPLQQRVVEQVLLKFLNKHSVFSDSYVNRQKEHATNEKLQSDDLIFDQVHVGTISQFIFQIAADDSVANDDFRKALYSVHKQYERRIREIGPENDVDIEGDSGNMNEIEDNDADCLNTNINGEIDDIDENSHGESSSGIKKKERKLVNNATPVATTTNNDKVNVEEPAVHKKVNSEESLIKPANPKKKKKKQDNFSAVAEEEPKPLPIVQEEEEVITISKADQKAARVAMNDPKEATTKNNKRPNDRSIEPEVESGTKRVKFGDINRARSYKASMNGLTKLVVKPILQKSPERSILLKNDNKNKVIAINDQPQQQRYMQNNNKKNHRNDRNRGKRRK